MGIKSRPLSRARVNTNWVHLWNTLRTAPYSKKGVVNKCSFFFLLSLLLSLSSSSKTDPQDEIYQLKKYYTKKWDQENMPSEPHKAQPVLTVFFLHPICFPLPPPIHSHNSFLKHPTHLQIKAIAVMAQVQAQAGRIKERQASLIQTHTAYLSPFWKPVTQM